MEKRERERGGGRIPSIGMDNGAPASPNENAQLTHMMP
jgi:hypothetical protein